MSTKAKRRRRANYPAYADRPDRAQTRRYAIHEHNPAGAKLVRRFYRAKHGLRDTHANEAKWYRAYAPKRARA